MRKYNPTKSKVFIDETGKVSFMYQQEGAREVAKEYPRDREWQKLVKKHKRAIEAFQKGRDLDSKAEKELVSWAMKNGEIKTDDVDIKKRKAPNSSSIRIGEKKDDSSSLLNINLNCLTSIYIL